MKRCSHLPRPSRRALLPLLALLLAAQAPLAQAQATVREFPRQALRGVLEVTMPPDVRLDGQRDRLSPGARIRDTENRLLLSGSLVGIRAVVNFTRDSSGLIHEVWLLTPAEAALKRERATPERNFHFQSEGELAPRDDGKTPFNQLPRWPNR